MYCWHCSSLGAQIIPAIQSLCQEGNNWNNDSIVNLRLKVGSAYTASLDFFCMEKTGMEKIFILKKYVDDFLGEVSIFKTGIPNNEK